MSELKELIAEFCPDGVEFATIGNICEITRGRVMSKDYLRENGGDYPVYSSQTANNGIFGYINTFDYDCESVTWTTDGANAGSVFYHAGEKFNITNVCGLLKVKDNNQAHMKFVYYALQVNAKGYVNDGMGNPKLMSNVMARVVIPLPPLPVQCEIVRILDNFSELTAELTAELTSRKKQYEYYRNRLLTFSDDVPMVPLGEIAEYAKPRVSAEKLNADNYVGVDNLVPDKGGKVNSEYVPQEGSLIGYKTDDILIGNIRPYLKKIWKADREGGTNGDVLVIRLTDKRVTPNFLYYLLASDLFFAYDMQHAKGAKMPRGDKSAIMRYTIPLPPFEEQARIVAILDKFDALTTDITSGLPAEIAARNKQYEYYLDKLLAFKEVGA